MNYIALDIGGVYIKSALVVEKNGGIEIQRTVRNPYNFRIHAADLKDSLTTELVSHLSGDSNVDAIIVTITAETVGIFSTIGDGIKTITSICEQAFPQIRIGYISVNGEFCDVKAVMKNPMKFASANWVATATLAAQTINNGLFIDIGSTTTDIIPIKNGQVVPRETTDLGRLKSGELIYSGIQRTYIAHIVDSLPYNDTDIPLAAEIRCFTAHVYVVLKILGEFKMLHPITGRNMKITRDYALDMIARSVCGDRNMLNDSVLLKMADHVRFEQCNKLINSLKRIINRNWSYGEEIQIMLTGSGKIIGKMALEDHRLGKIVTCDQFEKDDDNTTALALGILASNYLKQ